MKWKQHRRIDYNVVSRGKDDQLIGDHVIMYDDGTIHMFSATAEVEMVMDIARRMKNVRADDGFEFTSYDTAGLGRKERYGGLTYSSITL